MTTNQQMQIDSYLSGQMTADEVALFEREVQANPELRQELALQSDIVKGIAEYRKLQLKARLDAVNVSPGFWSTVVDSTYFQWMSGVAVVALIGVGVYYYFDQDEVVTPVQPTDAYVSSTDQEPETDVSSASATEPNSAVVEFEKRNTPPAVVEEEVTKDEVIADTNEKTFNPKVNAPDAGDVEAEKAFQPDKLPNPAVNESTNAKEEPLDVEIVDTHNPKVKYRYYAGKLYLYGNFSDEPYQILEINSATGRKVYLYHTKLYYELVPTDKETGASALTDKKLIEELDILRKAN